MPRGDGTGPMGSGSMTGRGAGFCAGFNTPGFANTVPGRGGMGCGRGRGRGAGFGSGLGLGLGWRNGRGFRNTQSTFVPAPYQQVDEISVLKNQAKYFGEALQSINDRINELEAGTK